jgi:hypothetical protein
VVSEYGDAQIDALKRALLVASLFALVALWVGGNLPAAPMGTGEGASERTPAET